MNSSWGVAILCGPVKWAYETSGIMLWIGILILKEINDAFFLSVQLLVAGGGMYVDVFNRGVIPLAYAIKRKNKDGVVNTYLDGIYLLFTYFTKPESMPVLEETLQTDDSVIRFSSFKVRKRKYWCGYFFGKSVVLLREKGGYKTKSFWAQRVVDLFPISMLLWIYLFV